MLQVFESTGTARRHIQRAYPILWREFMAVASDNDSYIYSVITEKERYGDRGQNLYANYVDDMKKADKTTLLSAMRRLQGKGGDSLSNKEHGLAMILSEAAGAEIDFGSENNFYGAAAIVSEADRVNIVDKDSITSPLMEGAL